MQAPSPAISTPAAASDRPSRQDAGPADSSSLHLAGLDALRLFALLLVIAQHAASLTEHGRWMNFHQFNLGTAGVAIFVAISGFLGGLDSRPPGRWLRKRLLRLYPAYWIVMAGSFLLAHLTGFKRFDLAQLVSQMAGTGLFTHGERLINVPTWFISLLLVCYLGLFLIRLWPWPRAAGALLALPLLAWLVATDYAGRLVHIPTFFAAAALAAAVPARWRPLAFAAAGLALLPRAPWSMGCAYTGVGFIGLGWALTVGRVPRWVSGTAALSYEMYLVHGIALVAAVRLLPGQPLPAIAAGLLLASLAAVMVRHLAAWRPAARRRWGRSVAD